MIDCVISSCAEMCNGSFDILVKINAAVSDLRTFEWHFSRLHSKRASEKHSLQTPEGNRNTLSFLTTFLVQYETGLRIIEHCMRCY